MENETNAEETTRDYERLTVNIIEVETSNAVELFFCETVTAALDELCENLKEYVQLVFKGAAHILIQETDSKKEVFCTAYLVNKLTLSFHFEKTILGGS